MDLLIIFGTIIVGIVAFIMILIFIIVGIASFKAFRASYNQAKSEIKNAKIHEN